MKHTLSDLFENNRRWAAARTQQDPRFFERLAAQQAPRYLWIGCADSRVPANEIVGLDPGELFVHRNVANVVSHTDLNCLAVLQYAVEVLKVEHIIVCGHYGCGGVAAALTPNQLGLIDNWLRLVRDVRMKHEAEIDAIESFEARVNRLCELNVRAQLARVSQTTIVQNAWGRGHPLTIHGWIYDIRDGLLKDLALHRTSTEDVAAPYRMTPAR